MTPTLTISEAAAWLRMPRASVYGLLLRGALTRIVAADRRERITAASVEQYQRARLRQVRTEGGVR